VQTADDHCASAAPLDGSVVRYSVQADCCWVPVGCCSVPDGYSARAGLAPDDWAVQTADDHFSPAAQQAGSAARCCSLDGCCSAPDDCSAQADLAPADWAASYLVRVDYSESVDSVADDLPRDDYPEQAARSDARSRQEDFRLPAGSDGSVLALPLQDEPEEPLLHVAERWLRPEAPVFASPGAESLVQDAAPTPVAVPKRTAEAEAGQLWQ